MVRIESDFIKDVYWGKAAKSSGAEDMAAALE